MLNTGGSGLGAVLQQRKLLKSGGNGNSHKLKERTLGIEARRNPKVSFFERTTDG